MPTEISSQDFYNMLRPDIVGKTGQIIFELNNVSVTINTKDSIGHMLQDWVEAWARGKNIYIRPNPSTQEFPDFYLSTGSHNNLLEIKSFDFTASPNFDIANFETYVRSLLIEPNKLDADYLIFGYSLHNGILKVEDIWLKKIWELSTNSAQYALKIQQKQGTIYNIRPVNFVSTNPNSAQPFKTKVDFLVSIQSVLNQYPKTQHTHINWLTDFKRAYNTATGISL